MDCVRSSISRIDNIGRSAKGVSWDAAGIFRSIWILNGVDTGARSRVYRLKGSSPPVLRKIIEIEAKASAHHGCSAAAGQPGESQSRCELLVVVARCMRNQRNAERSQGDVAGIESLGPISAIEQAKRGRVAQAVAERQSC